jgi:hypothetical protein
MDVNALGAAYAISLTTQALVLFLLLRRKLLRL